MVRALFHGYIALGRLGIPIRLYAGTQASGLPFVQLHQKDLSPIERVVRCRLEHRPVKPEEIAHAVEYEPGKYVTLSDDEIAHTAQSATKVIAIQQFSFDDAIPPQYFQKPFYVVPGPGGERSYALLREVFASTHRMAIATYVFRNRAHLGSLRVDGDVLILLQLRFTSELVPRSMIATPALGKPSPTEVDALSAVVERFSGLLYMQDYHDEYAEKLKALIERKTKGLPAIRESNERPQATSNKDLLRELKSLLQYPGHRLVEPELDKT